MEKVQNVISKVYKVIVYIAVMILLLGVNVGNITSNGIVGALKTIIFILLGLFLIFLNNKFIISKIKNDKIHRIVLIIGLILFLILEVISYKFFKVKYNWDFGTVMQAAEDVANNGVSDKIEYFLNYPHNTGCLAFETTAMFLFGKKPIGAYILNIVSIFFAALFGVLASKKLSGYKGAINTMLLILLFVPLYLYTPIVYTDTLAVMFPVLTIYLYLLSIENKDNKKKKYLFWILMTIVNVIGFKIKPVAAIVYVAIILDMLFTNKKVLKDIIISVLIFVILMPCLSSVMKKVFVKTNITMNIKVPTMHYIMLGLSKPVENGGTGIGWGSYNEPDFMYTMTKSSYEEKNHADKVMIKERLKDYGVFGYVDFLWNKLKFTWNDGTYYSTKVTGLDTINTESKLYELILGKYSLKISVPYMNYFNDTVMILILAGFIFDLKNNKSQTIRILEISMVGIAMFLLVWETRSRYIYFMIPVFCVLASNSINIIFEKMNYNKINLKTLGESKEVK